MSSSFELLRRERAARPVSRTMMDAPLRVTDVMRRAELLFPDVEVVSRHGPGDVRRSSYRAVAREALALAGALKGLGIAPGQRVATLMWNHAAHLAVYYAVPAIGAVLHPLNPRLIAEELAYIVADAGDVALLVDDDLLPLWRQVAQHVCFDHVIVHPLGTAPAAAAEALAHGDRLWDETLASATPLPGWPEDAFDERDPVSICYTSGTTGRPKGVVYSHRSILLHGLGAATPDALNLSGRDTVMALAPMFHANAWSMPHTSAMLGQKQVFTGPRASPAEILDLFVNEQANVSLGVPTFWSDVLNVIDQHPGRWTFPAGTRIYCGGSAPPPEMFRRFDRLGVHLQTGWGMTETSPMGSQTWVRPEYRDLTGEDLIDLRVSNGLPLPFIEMRHVDEAGSVQPRDGVAMGELQVRGPWVTSAYIGHPQPISATTADGWMKTGDIVVFQPDGYMRLVDRLKDLVKSGGEWISSVDMEKALCEHPAVAEAAVIAVPDERWSERPLALLVLKPGHDHISAADIQDHLRPRFAKWMVPDHIEFVPALPRTSVGKLNKLALRHQYGDAAR